MRRVKTRGSRVLLPAEAQRTVPRAGEVRVPVHAELDLTPPHPQKRAAIASATTHRAWKIDQVLAHRHDVGVVSVGVDAFHGRASLDVTDELVAAVIRTALAVPATIVVAEPERSGGDGEAVVEGLDRTVVITQLLELDAQELAGAQQSWTRIGEREQPEVGVVLDQTFWDLRDASEVDLEVLGVDRWVSTEALVPEALGLDPPLVHTTHLQATNQFLDFWADAFLAGAQTRRLDLMQFGHVADIEQSHLNLRKPVTSQEPKPYIWYADKQICTVPPCRCAPSLASDGVCLQNRRISAQQTTRNYTLVWRKRQGFGTMFLYVFSLH